MKEQLHHFFDREARKTALVSAVTVLIILAGTFAVIWQYRAPIFKYFASEYARQLAAASPTKDTEDPETVVEALVPALAAAEDADIVNLAGMKEVANVETAVERANPAVVAITATKTVPKYKLSYQQSPFLDMFGTLNLQMPTQVPDGTEERQVGAGSGFIVSADGLIVTNRHVVEDKEAKYAIFLSNGKKYDATVLARDAVLDVAILKVSASGLPYLSLGDSDKLKLGQSVVAIGNALGQFQNTVSVGVISGLSRSIIAGNGGGLTEALDRVIQTDAAINPGNSGGPLLNLSGEVVGVDTAIVQGSQNIGFALPINSIKSVIESVRATGKIIRPYLGIRYQEVTPELRAANNLTVDYGALVKRGEGTNALAVIPGSPADKAGIVENDIILEIDGVKLDKDHDLAQIIRNKKVGQTVKLGVLSKGVSRTVSVLLSSAPEA